MEKQNSQLNTEKEHIDRIVIMTLEFTIAVILKSVFGKRVHKPMEHMKNLEIDSHKYF